MKRSIFFVLLGLSLAFLVSCSKNNPTEPSGQEAQQVLSNASGQPIPTVADNVFGVLATINFELQSIPGIPAVGIAMGFAQFGDGLDAGTVSVNAKELGKTTQTGKTIYITPSPSNPTQSLDGLSFDGSEHKWNVSGGNGVSKFSTAVKSPKSFSVTAPTGNATVDKSKGIIVSWNNSSPGSKVLIALVSQNNPEKLYISENLDDNGSFTIPASKISGMSGQSLLEIVKFNYNLVDSGGKTYAVISEIVKTLTITLN
ncbi:MAG: hypothetical protein D6814_07240 [Calditrichaeota bacterium]|nr:MAG: hypothetical protein D6814_07240 [Calditrichota bacterium]